MGRSSRDAGKKVGAVWGKTAPGGGMAAVCCHWGNQCSIHYDSDYCQRFQVLQEFISKNRMIGLKWTRYVDVKLFEMSILHSFYPFSCELSGIARFCRDSR